MSIDALSDSNDSFNFYNFFAEAISWNEAAPQGVCHDLSIYACRLGSYLTEPVWKAHELYHHISVVEQLNPDGHPLMHMATKVSMYVAMAGWFTLACFTTVPGVALQFLGVHLQNTPFIYMQAPGAYGKTLPKDRTFSF